MDNNGVSIEQEPPPYAHLMEPGVLTKDNFLPKISEWAHMRYLHWVARLNDLMTRMQAEMDREEAELAEAAEIERFQQIVEESYENGREEERGT